MYLYSVLGRINTKINIIITCLINQIKVFKIPEIFGSTLFSTNESKHNFKGKNPRNNPFVHEVFTPNFYYSDDIRIYYTFNQNNR